MVVVVVAAAAVVGCGGGGGGGGRGCSVDCQLLHLIFFALGPLNLCGGSPAADLNRLTGGWPPPFVGDTAQPTARVPTLSTDFHRRRRIIVNISKILIIKLSFSH